jgi:excisionase family DNA binding protein
MKEVDDFLTAEEAAEYLKISVNHLQEYSNRGVIPVCRVGDRKLWSRHALIEWAMDSLELVRKKRLEGEDVKLRRAG